MAQRATRRSAPKPGGTERSWTGTDLSENAAVAIVDHDAGRVLAAPDHHKTLGADAVLALVAANTRHDLVAVLRRQHLDEIAAGCVVLDAIRCEQDHVFVLPQPIPGELAAVGVAIRSGNVERLRRRDRRRGERQSDKPASRQ